MCYACERARVNDGGGSVDDGGDAKHDNNNDDVDVAENETDTRLSAFLRVICIRTRSQLTEWNAETR